MAEDLSGLLTAVVAVVTLPLGILTALFVGTEEAAVVFVVGWLLLVPLIAIVGDELAGAGEEDGEEPAGPLEELKGRYARGEIDEAEFERRVDRLLETEEGDATAPRQREREREHEVE
jgi:uncharacterized membrane protein